MRTLTAKLNSIKNYPRFILITLIVIYFINFLLNSRLWLTYDLASSLKATYASEYRTGQPPIVSLLLLLFGWTNNGIFIYQLIAGAIFVWILWWTIQKLDQLKFISRLLQLFLLLFVILSPDLVLLFTWTSKEQFIAPIFLVLMMQLLLLMLTKNPTLKQILLIAALLIVLALFKALYMVILIPFLIVLIAKHQYILRNLSILLGSILVELALSFLLAFIPAGQFDSGQAGDVLSVPSTGVAYIYLQDDSNIPEDLDEYFRSAYSETFFDELSENFNPFLSDHVKPVVAQSTEFTNKGDNSNGVQNLEFWFNYEKLCFLNFDKCLTAWFNLESGFFIPANLQNYLTYHTNEYDTVTTLSKIPADTWFQQVVSKTMPSRNIYGEQISPVYWPLRDIFGCVVNNAYDENITTQWSDIDTCLKNSSDLGTSGSLVANNLAGFYNWPLYSNSVIPALISGYYSFIESFLLIFADDFWLFWINLLLLIIALTKPNFRKFLPLVLSSTLVYLALFFFAPISYERYTLPLFFAIPFTAIIFLSQTKYFKVRSSKKN